MAFDPKCLELAEYFLSAGTRKLQEEFAQYIQDAVEDWMRFGAAPERDESV